MPASWTKEPQISWDEKTKTKWVKRMKEHRAADRLIRGSWLQDVDAPIGQRRGCFFGCAMQTDENALEKAAKVMNIPLWLINLSEGIFEGMPEENHLEFPVDLLEAIPCNVDLQAVEHEIAVIRLKKIRKHASLNLGAFDRVIELHEVWREATREDWESAWASAASESASASESARASAWASASASAWASACESAWASSWDQERVALLDSLRGLSGKEAV